MTFNWMGLLAVGAGAVLGAWMRWILGVALNALNPNLPPGTLLANLLGAFLIGAAIEHFAQVPGLAPAWRLFIVTGFCGALTTFSSFSIEITTLLQEGRYGWLAGAIAAHVGGSLLMTIAGLMSWHWIQSR